MGVSGPTSPKRAADQRRRCEWCGRAFRRASDVGRPPKYCRHSCRQRDYEARLRAREVGLSDDELILARAELDTLRDRLYVLQCAVEDVERDLGEVESPDDVVRALEWLLEAARPLAGS